MEDDVLQDAMWQAVSDVMGKGRLDSLAAIEELTADPAQRATLRDFVMGASAHERAGVPGAGLRRASGGRGSERPAARGKANRWMIERDAHAIRRRGGLVPPFVRRDA